MRKSFAVVLMIALMSFAAFAQSDDKDTSFKADFIINLIGDVQWKSGGGLSDSSKIVIFVVGDSPVTAEIKELASGDRAKGKQIDVKVVTTSDDLKACHILFLPSEDFSKLAQVLKKVDGSKVVTVSDAKDFARYGVMINFFKEEGQSKTNIEINQLVVDMAGIKLSSSILKIASII